MSWSPDLLQTLQYPCSQKTRIISPVLATHKFYFFFLTYMIIFFQIIICWTFAFSPILWEFCWQLYASYNLCDTIGAQWLLSEWMNEWTNVWININSLRIPQFLALCSAWWFSCDNYAAWFPTSRNRTPGRKTRGKPAQWHGMLEGMVLNEMTIGENM